MREGGERERGKDESQIENERKAERKREYYTGR